MRSLDIINNVSNYDHHDALQLGYAKRVVPAGQALPAAVELAEHIASFPWTCVVHDRLSAYEGLGLGLDEGLANEDRHGQEVVMTPGFMEGVERFTQRPRG
jgi:enoyl-CoA hydratase